MNNIYTQLEKITIGFTTTIRGLIVTRWTSSSFEIGTIGKNQVSIHDAADRIERGE